MTVVELLATDLRVDRGLFVPDVIWVGPDGDLHAVSRVDDPEAWEAAVLADEPVVTQVDDGGTQPSQVGRVATSSLSKPSLVAAMLAALDVQRGQAVLEIGGGRGWTAALLCDRVGDAEVTTVEVDPTLAEQGREALYRNGFRPVVVVGDGALGWPPGAPYDRVSATCAVGDLVPYPWVEQSRPGGLIVTPFATEYHNGALARLTVHDDGTASGRFNPEPVAFMRLRDQRATVCPWGDGDGPGSPDTGVTDLSSSDILDVIGVGALAIGFRLPGVHKVVDEDRLHVAVHDPDSGSWARCRVGTPGPGPFPVEQYGPRRLWHEVEQARTWWVERGRPTLDRFGLTRTQHEQWAWLDDPTQLVRMYL